MVLCDLSHDACYVSTPLSFPPRCPWKHYLPATSFASGNNDLSDSIGVHNKHYFQTQFSLFLKNCSSIRFMLDLRYLLIWKYWKNCMYINFTEVLLVSFFFT